MSTKTAGVVMAGQPTPPGPRTPPRNSRPYENRAYENPLVSLNKGGKKNPHESGGVYVALGGGWSNSHDVGSFSRP